MTFVEVKLVFWQRVKTSDGKIYVRIDNDDWFLLAGDDLISVLDCRELEETYQQTTWGCP